MDEYEQMLANKLIGDAYDEVNRAYSGESELFAAYNIHLLNFGYELVDFDEAPEWANYWAMDRGGEAYWYSYKPVCPDRLNWWQEEEGSGDDGRLEKAPSFGLSPYYWKQSLTKRAPRIGKGKGTIKSDGGSTSYYNLPNHATELRHLISYKGMSKSRGDIFKACYRLGEKEGADALYDLNKMKFFVQDLIEMHSRGEQL